MSIRTNTNTKDHLSQSVTTLHPSPVEGSTTLPHEKEALRFYTTHKTKPRIVDLNVFKTGQSISSSNDSWKEPFSGRPELIAQLKPAIIDRAMPLAHKSVDQILASLRAWWRIFDSVEAMTEGTAHPITSVSQITDLHRQVALDRGIGRLEFVNFFQLANTTRIALGLKPLYWLAPSSKPVNRHLPSKWQTDVIRQQLKRHWFSVLDRWSLADDLRKQCSTVVEHDADPETHKEQQRLLRNYKLFDSVVEKTGDPRPSVSSLLQGVSAQTFYEQGFNYSDMLCGSYPDSFDIRVAFHLCMATTGWNPAVLLSLDVTTSIIEKHPKDPGRYILRGTKARTGGAEQLSEGLLKSQGSAGFIIQALIARTKSLRESLINDLHVYKASLAEMKSTSHTAVELELMRIHITSLEQGTKSPWIFVKKNGDDILWLTDENFSEGVYKKGIGYLSFIGKFIADLNLNRPKENQLSPLRASDFRDAYAATQYHASGGSILYVMKALGHRSIRSTQGYLNNTLLNDEHQKLFGTFSEALWSEIATHQRVDPTIIAQRSRYGSITPEHRKRLQDYRTLMRSRVGIACTDPSNPPRHIAPDFVADGKAMCHVQRCTLCLENAVLLPDSLPGLCKRLAELRYLRSRMSVTAFQESSFLKELDNTELALIAFDAQESTQLLEEWERRIESGAHRVIEFD